MPLTDRSARSGLCCRSRCEVAPRCTTRLENAHSTQFRELLYPWHPWSDLRIGIHEAIERPGGVVFRCDLTASDANRWLEIPAWMFDRSACAKVHLAVEPHTDLSALVMLGALLRDVRNIRSTASDAAGCRSKSTCSQRTRRPSAACRRGSDYPWRRRRR